MGIGSRAAASFDLSWVFSDKPWNWMKNHIGTVQWMSQNQVWISPSLQPAARRVRNTVLKVSSLREISDKGLKGSLTRENKMKDMSHAGKGRSIPQKGLGPVDSLIGLEMAVLYPSVDLNDRFFLWEIEKKVSDLRNRSLKRIQILWLTSRFVSYSLALVKLDSRRSLRNHDSPRGLLRETPFL